MTTIFNISTWWDRFHVLVSFFFIFTAVYTSKEFDISADIFAHGCYLIEQQCRLLNPVAVVVAPVVPRELQLKGSLLQRASWFRPAWKLYIYRTHHPSSSRHHGGLIEGFPEEPRSSQWYYTWGVWGGPSIGPPFSWEVLASRMVHEQNSSLDSGTWRFNILYINSFCFNFFYLFFFFLCRFLIFFLTRHRIKLFCNKEIYFYSIFIILNEN